MPGAARVAAAMLGWSSQSVQCSQCNAKQLLSFLFSSTVGTGDGEEASE